MGVTANCGMTNILKLKLQYVCQNYSARIRLVGRRCDSPQWICAECQIN